MRKLDTLGMGGCFFVGCCGLVLAACTSGGAEGPQGEPAIVVGSTAAALVWAQKADLVAPGLRVQELFGAAIAATETVVVVGAPQPYGSIGTQGAAYVFTKQGSWTFSQRLVPPEGKFFGFGTSVAISGSTIVIGAPADDTDVGNETGSVYVFVESNGKWVEQQRLRAADTHPLLFGQAVAIENDLIVVGHSQSFGNDDRCAYLFHRQVGAWTEEKVPVDVDEYSYLGQSVAVSGGRILFGCPAARFGMSSAHVLTHAGAAWLDEKLPNPDGLSTFGSAVALNGNTALVGDGTGAAAAYVWAKTGDAGTLGWTRTVNLDGRDLGSDSYFVSVALFDESTAVVGTSQPLGFGPPQTQRATVFTLSDGQLVASQTLDGLSSSGGEPSVVAINASSIFVGFDRGVTEWQRADENGKPCKDATTCASGFCSDGVCCNTDCSQSCETCTVSRGAWQDGTCAIASGSGVPACSTGACDGVHAGCPCAHDSDCPETAYCGPQYVSGTYATVCQPRLGPGWSCISASGARCKEPGCRICAEGTGGCVEGYCCDRACDGPCEACDLASSPGKCATIPGCVAPDSGATSSDAGRSSDAGQTDGAASVDAGKPSKDSGAHSPDATSPGSGGSSASTGGTSPVSSSGGASHSSGGAASTPDAGPHDQAVGDRIVGCGCRMVDERGKTRPGSTLAALLSIGWLRRRREALRGLFGARATKNSP